MRSEESLTLPGGGTFLFSHSVENGEQPSDQEKQASERRNRSQELGTADRENVERAGKENAPASPGNRGESSQGLPGNRTTRPAEGRNRYGMQEMKNHCSFPGGPRAPFDQDPVQGMGSEGAGQDTKKPENGAEKRN